MSEPLWLDQVLGDAGVTALTQRICGKLEREVRPAARIKSPAMLGRAVGDALAAALHIDVLSLLADGWNGARDLDDCRRRSLQAPGSTVIAALGRHSLSRDLKPEIIVSYGADKHFPIDVSLTVTATFEGIELAIKDGRLIGVGSGHGDVCVQFQMAGQDVDKPWRLKRWSLPGEYRFTPPLALATGTPR